MSAVVQFEKDAAKDSLVFRRFAPGTELQLGMETMLVRLDGDKWSLRLRSPQEKIVIDGEGAWYGVNYCRMLQRAGFSELIPYRVEFIPDQRFQLGFFAEMNIRAAHLPGLAPYMRSHGCMTMLALLNERRAPMEGAVARALEAAVDEYLPDLSRIKARRDIIESKVEAALFPLFYQNGLCLTPHSFSIKGFAPPLLR